MTLPRLLALGGDPPDPRLVEQVVRHLRGGGLVAMPTETVYGFGCGLGEDALDRLRGMKGRGGEKPFLILVPGRGSVADLGWTHHAEELAAVFWPGALTLILRDEGRRFPPGVRSPTDTVAVRQSPQPLARVVVEGLGDPVVSTSANPPGETPALDARSAWEAARELGAGEDLWVLDGGRLGPSPPSTIVDCSTDEPVVRREGSIPLNRLRCVLPDLRGPA